MYDHTVGELSARWLECIDSHGQPCRFTNPVFLAPKIVYFWSWELAIYDVVNDTTAFSPYNLDIGIITGRESLGSIQPWVVTDLLASIKSFGNQDVFGLSGKYGAKLLFFNPSLVPDLPDCEPDFHP